MSSVNPIKSLLKDYRNLDLISQNNDDFLTLVKEFGIKQLGKVPSNVMDSERCVRDLIKLDPYAFFYLPEFFHQDKFFKEVTRNHEILLVNPVNKKLESSTLNWIIDNCPSCVRFEFLKKPIPQLDNSNLLLREKIGITFLIEGVKIPKYLEGDVTKYKDLRIDELILIKSTIMSYEAIEAQLAVKDGKEVKVRKI